MLFDVWAKKYLGKAIDYDGAYGVQCVDLVKHYIKNVLGINPESIGNAIEYYNKRYSSAYLLTNFYWIDNTPQFIPKKGDICVFKSKSGNGHVSVATGEGTTSYFYSYDQNYPSSNHEPMTKIKHSYNSFLGVLRPMIRVGQTVTFTNNRKCYKSFKKSDGVYIISELTNYKSSDLAIIKAGNSVVVTDFKVQKSGNVWIEYKKGSHSIYAIAFSRNKNESYIV